MMARKHSSETKLITSEREKKVEYMSGRRLTPPRGFQIHFFVCINSNGFFMTGGPLFKCLRRGLKPGVHSG
jgi:hypothetical protein